MSLADAFSFINTLDALRPGERARYATRRYGDKGSILVWKPEGHVQMIGPERNIPARVTATWRSKLTVVIQLRRSYGWTGPVYFVRDCPGSDTWTIDTAANDMTRMGQVAAECFELLKQHNSDATLA